MTVKRLLTITNRTTDLFVNELDVGPMENRGPDVRFFLNITSLTGTTQLLDVTIEATVDGVDYVLGSFTQASGATNETIVVANCPQKIKPRLNFTNTITDCDLTLSAERL